MTEATPRHSSSRFFRESSTSFQDLSGSNQALARKNHVHARCRYLSRTPASWSRGSKAAASLESARGAKSACWHDVASPKKIILRKNVTN